MKPALVNATEFATSRKNIERRGHRDVPCGLDIVSSTETYNMRTKP